MLVYKITNRINNKCYIGSTKDFEARKYEHIIASTSDKYRSYNYPLQRAFRKYGIDNFNFEILEDNISLDEIATKEHDYIIKYDCLSWEHKGYNQTLYTDCAFRDPNYIQQYIQKYGSKCAEVDNNNKIINRYNSLHELARAFKAVGKESKFKDICEGKQNSFHGHIVRYIIDDEVIVPEQLTRPRRKKICGISIYNKQDIIYYDSVSEAARKEHAVRTSISKCISGKKRYTHVHNRIWRECINGEIIANAIDIDTIIFKYSGYCIVDYTTNKIYYGQTLIELAEKSGIAWAVIQRNIKLCRKVKNIGYYKVDTNGQPIIKEVI